MSSFWYDKKGKSYASKGTLSWLKCYIEHLTATVKGELTTTIGRHLEGEEGRHTAEDVDYSSTETVKEALDAKEALLKEKDASLEALLKEGDAALAAAIAKEQAARETAVSQKVDAVAGKGLSENDYTDAEKAKLSGIAEGATKGLSLDNKAAYTPTEAYHPATKQYADTLLANTVHTGDLMQPLNYFGGKGLYISALDNVLAGVDTWGSISAIEYTEDGTVLQEYPSSKTAQLFNGSYEEANSLTIAAGRTAVITIDFGGKFRWELPYGKTLLSFFSSGLPHKISARMYAYNGDSSPAWRDLTDIGVYNENQKGKVWYINNNGAAYYPLKMEISVTAPKGNATIVTCIEQQFLRGKNQFLSVVNKYSPQTLYYPLTAPSFKGELEGTAEKAICDKNGADITNTYATRKDVLCKTNQEAFSPTQNYHPATKKYVDDSVIAAGGGDMLRNVYDLDQNGVVDDAERLGGQPPQYYASLDAVDGKIDALKTQFFTPPALTAATPKGTKIGTEGWTGTGFFCTDTNVFCGVGTDDIPNHDSYVRFCLRPRDLSQKGHLGWTPYFVSGDTELEFVWSDGRGLYDGFVLKSEKTTEAVIAEHIVWKHHPPTKIRYGKLSNAFLVCKDKETNVVTKCPARSKEYLRDFSGLIGNEDYEIILSYLNGAPGPDELFATGDINDVLPLALAMEVSGDGNIDDDDWQYLLLHKDDSIDSVLPINLIDQFS